MLKVFWFRKDLRLFDSKTLTEFANSIRPDDSFLFLYIKNKNNHGYFGEKRIAFLYECLTELNTDLNKSNLHLNIQTGNSLEIFENLINKFGQIEVYANKQIEPYNISRDDKIGRLMKSNSGNFIVIDDTTIMPASETVKDDGLPYTVYTPFKNKFLKILNVSHYFELKVNLAKLNSKKEILLKNNFDIRKDYNKLDKSDFIKGGRSKALILLNNFIKHKLKDYGIKRDYPALDSTSLLSAHLHFGTINIRECFRAYDNEIKKSDKPIDISKWRDELIWREFYYNIVFHFPYVIDGAFKKYFNNIKWNNDGKVFKLWCESKTGFPIVDAGMRQLKKEGWMHNRVRMIVAMFLTKDLMIDWRLGEKYFAENLIDLDFASNNGGWQWSASTGCDAQPYFRIFNPYLQSKKFDLDGIYIKHYVPELKDVKIKYIHNPSEMPAAEQTACGVIIGKDYPAPIVNHSEASKKTIKTFKEIKS